MQGNVSKVFRQARMRLSLGTKNRNTPPYGEIVPVEISAFLAESETVCMVYEVIVKSEIRR